MGHGFIALRRFQKDLETGSVHVWLVHSAAASVGRYYKIALIHQSD